MTLFCRNLIMIGLLCAAISCGVGLKPRSLSTDLPPIQNTVTETGDEDFQEAPSESESSESDAEDENALGETNMNGASSSDNAEENNDSNESSETTAESGLSCFEIYYSIGDCYDSYYACAYDCEDDSCITVCEEDYYVCFDNEVNSGSEQGQTDFYQLRSCEEQNYYDCYDNAIVYYDDCTSSCADQACVDGCTEEANALYSDCMIESCNDEYIICGLIEGELEN